MSVHLKEKEKTFVCGACWGAVAAAMGVAAWVEAAEKVAGKMPALVQENRISAYFVWRLLHIYDMTPSYV